MEKFESGILEIIELSPSVKHLKIWVSEDFKFISGQYISFIMEIDNKKLRRPYSICSSPSEKGYVDLCIKIIENGLASEMINGMQVDDNIQVLGPLGDFTIKNKNKDLVFISSGSGIGPFRSMIKDLLENNFEHNIALITGYRSEEDILYDNEFTQLQEEHENFEYKSALSQPSPTYKGQEGYVQDLIKNLTPSKEADYYLCGLNDMITSVRALLVKKGVSMSDIYSEKYD